MGGNNISRYALLEDNNQLALLTDLDNLTLLAASIANEDEEELRLIFGAISGVEHLKEIIRFRLDELSNVVERSSNRRYAERSTRDRGYALREMDELSDAQFARMFRLNREAFYFLLAKIITPKVEAKPNGGGACPSSQRSYNERLQPITPKTRLAVTLRWLAGLYIF